MAGIISFHPCIEADEQIVLGSGSLESGHRELVRKADAVILPQERRGAELFMECRALCSLIFPNYLMRFRFPGKTGQGKMFKDLGLPHPRMMIWESVRDFVDVFEKRCKAIHDFPFVIKCDDDHEAKGLFIVVNREELEDAVSFLRVKESAGSVGFITQQYVECEGNILRTVIIGKGILTYWKRPGPGGGKITTISAGARIDHSWRPDIQEKAMESARRLSLLTGIDLAAVDYLFPAKDCEQEPLILEVNYYFGRRGLGGSERYYGLLFEAIRGWLKRSGLDAGAVRLL